MERITLANDLHVSRIIHGMWRLAEWNMSDGELLAFVEACVDMGITTFDHADIYGSYTCESLFGKALAQKPSLRAKLQLVTKCGIKLVSPNRPAHKLKSYDTSKAHIVASVENSLKQLRTDYVDLLLIHRPDPLMDPTEVADAFTELHRAGKVRHFGVSNFTPSQYEMLQSYLSLPLVTNQVELSAVHLDKFRDGTIEHCLTRRIPPMAWSPLGGGTIFRSEEERFVRLRRTLAEIAAEIGAASIEQVMYAWLLMHPAKIMPIAGSGKLERVKMAVEALPLRMSREQWFAVWQSSMGREVE